MADNKILSNAKIAKQDEFYTQLEDIELEMKHYKSHFKGKVVFCNCDDPYESNFFKYFAMNFNYLGLKKLIATCYVTSPVMYTQLSLFTEMEFSFNPKATKDKKPYKVEISEVADENGDGAFDLEDIKELLKNKKNVCTVLEGDGDFRSEECISLLKEADIVVTNPPFSLFREYIAQLIEFKKSFIIIGNQNATHYKEVFPLIKENKAWYGASIHSGDREFRIPDHYEVRSKSVRTDNEGHRYLRVVGVRWFTNLDYEKRHEELILYKTYNPREYPKFDNFDAININKTIDIPCDYYGVMGVPDTFLDKYNPEQFEIIGRSGDTEWVMNNCEFFTPPTKEKQEKYKKQNKTWRVQNAYLLDDNEVPIIVYSRIFIRRKEQ